jgi:hypothetical protein
VRGKGFCECGYEEVDHRVENWATRYPDVRVHPVATHGNVTQFLAENKEESVQLTVVGGDQAPEVVQIIGPHSRPLVAHGDCSVLIVR